MFDRTAGAKGMKTKSSKETVRSFLELITKKTRPKANWVETKTKTAGEFRKFCRYKFALQRVRLKLHLLNVQYDIWKCSLTLNWRPWLEIYPQIVSICHNTEFQKKCLVDLIPKNVKKSDFLSVRYSKPLAEVTKPKLQIGDKIRIFKYDWPFRKDYGPQFRQEVFGIKAISSIKPPTYTKKMNWMRL